MKLAREIKDLCEAQEAFVDAKIIAYPLCYMCVRSTLTSLLELSMSACALCVVLVSSRCPVIFCVQACI